VEELKQDAKTKTDLALSYRELGYTLNEVNERFDLGMDAVEDEAGNTRLVPQNMIPFTDYTEPVEEEKSVDSDILVEKRAQAPRGLARRHHNLERKVETQIHNKLRKYFSNQLGKVKGVVKDTKDIDRSGILIGVKTLLEEEKVVLEGFMVPIYEEGSKEAVGLAAEAMDIIAEPHINDRVVREMTNKIKDINNHTYNLVRKQVLEAANTGESIDQLSKRIDKVYKFNASRSRTIARTESGSLINRSTNEEYAQAGVKMKRWLANPGARESHSHADGQGAIPFNAAFDNGMMYPHDPAGPAQEIVNCRCTLVPVVETES
jgi:SPP1 gp7 family putative phage head morphogenesis protein